MIFSDTLGITNAGIPTGVGDGKRLARNRHLSGEALTHPQDEIALHLGRKARPGEAA